MSYNEKEHYINWYYTFKEWNNQNLQQYQSIIRTESTFSTKFTNPLLTTTTRPPTIPPTSTTLIISQTNHSKIALSEKQNQGRGHLSKMQRQKSSIAILAKRRLKN